MAFYFFKHGVETRPSTSIAPCFRHITELQAKPFQSPPEQALEFDVNGGDGGTWQRLDHLGDWALFVGKGNSWPICTTNVPNCRSSCIYFADDNWDQQGRGGRHHDRDIGMYDMQSKKIERLEFGSHTPGHHSRN
ncbi:hypothetical protein COLO4_25593 [Corchorus olitorius]|uniref:KIB1-4 beta-propeller domain-containing protein n=1 Tax=Corchorus olitorius TaxID=93759 RepID=A0A1R3I164_9ROSI|nr:hypothetical protein COLO4_25593 [Corchorus olitorius]